MGTSMFESVRMIAALKMAYVVFPTVSAAKTIHKVERCLTMIDAEWVHEFEWQRSDRDSLHAKHDED